MVTAGSEMVDLNVSLDEFDARRAIGIRQVQKLVHGRNGHVSIEVLRRWANPGHGCRPCGEGGPVLVLPAVRVSGQLFTMPDWVQLFERRRLELGSRIAERPQGRPPRSREAAHRRAEARLDRAGIGGRGQREDS